MAKAVRLLKLEKVLSNLEEKFMIRANVLKVTYICKSLICINILIQYLYLAIVQNLLQVINLIVGTVCGAHITACLFSYFARIDQDSLYSDSWVLQ